MSYSWVRGDSVGSSTPAGVATQKALSPSFTQNGLSRMYSTTFPHTEFGGGEEARDGTSGEGLRTLLPLLSPKNVHSSALITMD